MENSMVGKRFGKLVVLKEYKAGKWLMCTCQCDCGKLVEVRKYSLTSGNTTSCGCSRREDLTGKRFGRLTVIAYAGYKGCALWRCRCDCGKEIVTRASSLKNSNTTSCGCAVDPSKLLQDRVDGTRLGGISPKRKARGASGVKGVSWDWRREKWEAYIALRGHKYHLGLYDTLEAAAEARRKAEEEYFSPILEKNKKKPLSTG